MYWNGYTYIFFVLNILTLHLTEWETIRNEKAICLNIWDFQTDYSTVCDESRKLFVSCIFLGKTFLFQNGTKKSMKNNSMYSLFILSFPPLDNGEGWLWFVGDNFLSGNGFQRGNFRAKSVSLSAIFYLIPSRKGSARKIYQNMMISPFFATLLQMEQIIFKPFQTWDDRWTHLFIRSIDLFTDASQTFQQMTVYHIWNMN